MILGFPHLETFEFLDIITWILTPFKKNKTPPKPLGLCSLLLFNLCQIFETTEVPQHIKMHHLQQYQQMWSFRSLRHIVHTYVHCT